MPANLEKRGATWHARFVIGGKLYRKTTGFSDLARAKRRATELENDIRSGKLGWAPKDVPTFAVWQTKFLAAFYPGKYAEAHMLKRANLRWGTRTLDTITPSDAQQFFRDMESDGYAGGTRERMRVLLKRLFRTAIADKLIDANPLADIRCFKGRVRDRVLSVEDEAKLRAALRPMWDRYLTVALGTGLRAGEMRTIRPADLRHNGTWLWIRPETTKTRKGREVPLTPDVMTALTAQQEDREGDETVAYFPLGQSAAANVIKRTCAKIKIRKYSPHDLRRTFATRCAEKRMYPKHLQSILGHSDISVTMGIYVKLEQASVRDALMETVK